jgi:hypothetical protein
LVSATLGKFGQRSEYVESLNLFGLGPSIANAAPAQAPSPGQVATPTFTPAAGTFADAQNVTIECATAGAAIYYTIDGSVPTAASPLYAAPVAVAATTTIKAIATKAGMDNSAIASGTFTIGAAPPAGTGDPSGLAAQAVSWTSLTNATYAAPNLQESGTLPAGAVSDTPLDTTKQFVVECDFKNDGTTDATVVYLDDNATADFVWDNTLTFVAGIYTFGGDLFGPVGGYAATGVGALGGTSVKMRFYNSGNDLICEKSLDAGATWANVYTAAGVLAGKATLYVKALFAVAGAAKIAVRQAQAA